MILDPPGKHLMGSLTGDAHYPLGWFGAEPLELAWLRDTRLWSEQETEDATEAISEN